MSAHVLRSTTLQRLRAFYTPASVSVTCGCNKLHGNLLSSSGGRNSQMMKTIHAPYLILVDEEQHDGQDLQEEDEQEEDEELQKYKRKGRGVIFNIICQRGGGRPQGEIIGLYV